MIILNAELARRLLQEPCPDLWLAQDDLRALLEAHEKRAQDMDARLDKLVGPVHNHWRSINAVSKEWHYGTQEQMCVARELGYQTCYIEVKVEHEQPVP